MDSEEFSMTASQKRSVKKKERRGHAKPLGFARVSSNLIVHANMEATTIVESQESQVMW